ncbi:MAG: hypothetical protein AB8V23_03400 [Candidatus Midichloria sp.]|uniref:Uncharacterized protein n=1 Tax=Hyalomma marginatum TaxID=34627 RepID=A0A8S4C2D1_9ACAR|nr:hypothetical protein MHYMCMPASI_00544 [Hyalomma marginatum]CAG7592790.1 hypothetical protein MHYMCMPSP_00732 [Hyalomma marginatum]
MEGLKRGLSTMHLYISQMEKGGEYEDLKEVIFLAITEYIMF